MSKATLIGGEEHKPQTHEERVKVLRAQQAAAEARAERAAGPTIPREDEAKAKRRHELLREFGREIAHEHEADIERGRERDLRRDRDRDRSR